MKQTLIVLLSFILMGIAPIAIPDAKDDGSTTLCSTSMDADKAYAIELVDGKAYFVTYTRRHPTAAHIRSAVPTLMDCEEFGEWAAEENLTLVER